MSLEGKIWNIPWACVLLFYNNERMFYDCLDQINFDGKIYKQEEIYLHNLCGVVAYYSRLIAFFTFL